MLVILLSYYGILMDLVGIFELLFHAQNRASKQQQTLINNNKQVDNGRTLQYNNLRAINVG